MDEDSGRYVCRAVNGFGSVDVVIHLWVHREYCFKSFFRDMLYIVFMELCACVKVQNLSQQFAVHGWAVTYPYMNLRWTFKQVHNLS